MIDRTGHGVPCLTLPGVGVTKRVAACSLAPDAVPAVALPVGVRAGERVAPVHNNKNNSDDNKLTQSAAQANTLSSPNSKACTRLRTASQEGVCSPRVDRSLCMPTVTHQARLL